MKTISTSTLLALDEAIRAAVRRTEVDEMLDRAATELIPTLERIADHEGALRRLAAATRRQR